MSQDLSRSFVDEYRYFLEHHLFRLLGIVCSDEIKLTEKQVKRSSSTSEYIAQCNSNIIFGTGNWDVFELSYKNKLPNDNIKLARSAIQAFIRIAENKRTGSRSLNKIFTKQQRIAIYNMAIQTGICDWLCGYSNRDRTEQFFGILETWAVKTYEGNHVTLGFVINPDEQPASTSSRSDWLDFLQDDSSAVFTDCIHSIIELDCTCNFSRYHSISQGDTIHSYVLDHHIPLRFSQVIQKYVDNNKVGVFLLSNGDIILVKESASSGYLCFVKRNLQWLNLSYDAFSAVLRSFDIGQRISNKLIESVFASVLDISFSHAGGIISIATNIDLLANPASSNSILNPCDNLLIEEPDQKLIELMKNQEDNISESEINKRLLKRTVIKSLINCQSFISLDRKLRCELMSLDGACILNTEGAVCSFGAIIRYNSGSSGGGRSAAAKMLSEYGMAVKISTDGYIELYINKELVYSIK